MCIRDRVEMSIKVGINGFGRIGRQVLRISLDRSDIEVVAINDIADLKTCFQLLKYDSVFGQLNREVNILDDGLQVDLSGLVLRDGQFSVLSTPGPSIGASEERASFRVDQF